MSMIGRRLFSGMFAAAPVAAAGAKVMTNHPIPVDPAKAIGESTAKFIREAMPPQMKAYETAMTTAYKARDLRYQVLRLNDPSARRHPNITALRSVSPQHKIHMEIAAEEKFHEDQLSLTQKLRDAFGLTDWFAKRELSPGPSEAGSGMI